MTTRQKQLLALISRHQGWSATELANLAQVHPANLSSELKRMTDRGLLRRTKGEGPRGGYGYWLAKQ